jgi:hypothetical protein
MTNPINTASYSYDNIDFVLGGKVTNCQRRELLYTTADAEGMTGDAVRTKYNGNPAHYLLAKAEVVTPSAAKNKAGAKEFCPPMIRQEGTKDTWEN